MKLYNEEKQKEIWNKDKTKGKIKYVIRVALIFEVSMLTGIGIGIILISTIFKIYCVTPLQFTAYAIMCGVGGIICGIKAWDARTREFDKIGILEENTDMELKSLILKTEKIKAIKRYRIVTGLGFRHAFKYVEFYSEKYSK